MTAMADDKIYLGNTDVSCRSTWWSHVESKRFTILNFADITGPIGSTIEIPIFEAHGLDWKLQVFPRGQYERIDSVEYVSCRLDLKTSRSEDVHAKIATSCGNRQLLEYDHLYKQYHSGSTFNCCRRSTMLKPSNKYLVDGDLILDVDIQIMIPTQSSAPVQEWKPKPRSNDSFLTCLWKDQKQADIKFMVENKLIPAHKVVLRYHASQLLDLVLEADSGDEDVVMIDVSHDLFNAIMCFIYTGNLPDNFVTGVEDAKAVLDAADRFGCVELKLRMEHELATVHLTALNAIDLLLLADAHSCAFLKEAVMNLYRKIPQHIKASQGWMTLVENSPALALVKGLLGDTRSSKRSRKNRREVDTRSVSALRNQLENDGLSIDGSRETLVKRIKKAHTSKL